MSSTPGPSTSTTTPSTNPKIDPQALDLYNKCLSLTDPLSPSTSTFNQADLLSLNIAPDAPSLMKLCQSLMQHNLFQVLLYEGAPCYRCRTTAAAAKMAQMGDKEYLVYGYIEASHTAGIWTKSLSIKANLHQTVLTKALKWLEGKGWVKQIKSVKFPKRKIYMLKELQPAEDVTGGPWFSDGEMDVDLIVSISRLVEDFVKQRSWRLGPRVKPDVPAPSTTTSTDANSTQPRIHRRDERYYGAATLRKRTLLPYDAGYTGYPTPSDVLNFLDQTAIVQGKDISVPDMTHLLDVLVYDGKLERIGTRQVPRARSRTAGGDGAGNGEEGAEGREEGEHGDGGDSGGESDAAHASKKRKTTTPLTTKDKGKSRATSTPNPSIPNPSSSTPAPLEPADPEPEPTYRWIRRPDAEDEEVGPGNGFSEAPCSRCPVFRLCEEGGPVDARSCGYFGGWLEKGREGDGEGVGEGLAGA